MTKMDSLLKYIFVLHDNSEVWRLKCIHKTDFDHSESRVNFNSLKLVLKILVILSQWHLQFRFFGCAKKFPTQYSS